MVNVSIEEINQTLHSIYSKTSLTQSERNVLIDTLLDAELRGIKSHGLIRVKSYYLRLINAGITCPTSITKINDQKATAILDGNNGVGQFIAYEAMKDAIKKAQAYGIGAISVKNSQHFGTASYFAKMASDEDMIGIVLTNASPRLAPWNGNQKMLGNNPWAIALPSGYDKVPFVLDIANSNSAGKIRKALIENEEIPSGWALNSEGTPTNNPEEALNGILLPIGEHKGYGITLAFSMICSLLGNSPFDSEVKSVDSQDQPQHISHFFIAINISFFQSVTHFKKRAKERFDQITSSKRIDSNKPIFYPGQRGYIQKEKLLKTGNFSISEQVYREIMDL